MQDHAADHLNIEVAHAEGADGAFANDREGLFKDVVQALAIIEAASEFVCLGLQFAVRERLHLGLQRVDPLDALAHRLDLSVIRGTEHFAG